jgi:putative flippase GtrA
LPRLIGFTAVGAGGFFVHGGMIYVLTHYAGLGAITAWFPAFGLAVVFTWLLNRYLSFRGLKTDSVKSEAARYFTIQSLGAGLNFAAYGALITLAVPYFSKPLLALAIGSALAFGFNYVALRKFVYRAG